MNILENVPLSDLTTMRLGGAADFVIDVETPENCPEALDFTHDHHLPVYFLGSGANTIGLDDGFRGVILRNRIMGLKILEETESELVVRVGGGVTWDDFVQYTVEKDFSGVELLAKIPSSVAAAPVQNIGAYGAEVASVVKTIEAYDTLLDEFVELPNDQCDFAYRHSIFNSGETKGRYFILTVTFHLSKTRPKPPFYNSLQSYLDEHKITDYSPKNLYAAVAQIRSEKLPDPQIEASAGSFFKNIYVDAREKSRLESLKLTLRADQNGQYKVNVAQVLDLAGLKGQNFHGFEISEKAPLVLINRSAESEHDLELAKSEITQIVNDKFGLKLEQEPEMIR